MSLHVIGIGANGLESLAPSARAALDAAEIIVGGARHHALTATVEAERISWPSPFDALVSRLEDLAARRVAVLATGDPLWFSVGEKLAEAFPSAVFHPQLSAFQLAAARMGWPMDAVETLSIHGRPAEVILPFLRPGGRLLLLTGGSDCPGHVADLLVDRGFGRSMLTVLSDLGGDERRTACTAEDWKDPAPSFHTLAVDLVAAAGAQVFPRSFGLPDEAFDSDGTMTKREVRALTLAALAPAPGALLWDVGTGAGSVAIEWMRAARGARAIGIEPRAERRALAAANATALGAPGLEIVAGDAPAALEGLPAPDAIFFGGGLSEPAFTRAWDALKPHGRLVANAVTLETETTLAALHGEHGGALTRISIQRAEPVGRRTGWKPAMPVTQLTLVKP
ncbi:MAG: precorrin-6y C5,15-methyltransferase (decarboxylating) subunit CbiE [Pseudomonadota bacterium]